MTQQIPPLPLQYATPSTSGPSVRTVALAQRFIMWVILGSILLMLSLVMGAAITPSGGMPQLVVIGLLILIRLALLALMMVGVYKLSAALGLGVVTCVLYVIGMIIPLVNLIILLSVNQKATNLLKRNGIKVGLMGASLSDVPVG
jgi:hypothetical protein